ncbi:MAG: carbamoyltransferase HypF [Deltaproteobacteria bacterium]|nr:carbamoyltransferase HypF [Deltaproteobacteria bacterium]
MGKYAPLIRRHYKITGIVQGVGFRPFVYRLAHELGLSGLVRNSPAGVEIEAQGLAQALAAFEQALSHDAPPLAVISSITSDDIPIIDDTTFEILPSSAGEPDIQIAPDSALCSDCLRELFDPSDRRYRYPFITCTNCGPRYSIITGIPYDRPKTTMADFPLCQDCFHEYIDPLNRRFHAQPVACHSCGPQVSLLKAPSPPLPLLGRECCSSTQRGEVGRGEDAILQAVDLLLQGHILAVKGIGGYHLAVDACNPAAVQKLRERKQRDEKPFAVMTADLEAARRLALMNETEERLLVSAEAPIVIVRKSPDCQVSPQVAPNNGWLGLMLPYAPLHHLLFGAGSTFDVQSSMSTTTNVEPRTRLTALVMTSGNISDEPVAFEDEDAIKRLSGIADYFLIHNRPIHIRSDDSVMRVFQGKPLFYRRARGYAPRAVKLPFQLQPLLAVGAELKSSVCLARNDQAFLSQHIGDLQNDSSYDSFCQTIHHLSDILEIRPAQAACDLHPDYLSSRYAEESGLPLLKVQHHHAHLASCMAENGLSGEVIGVIFDGTGYGPDGTVWGGEFLVGGYDGYSRAAHFRNTPLPGGDAAVREPWRMAVSYLYQALGEAAFSTDHPAVRQLSDQERRVFVGMLSRGINSPMTSSCGRLFDAVSALLDLRHEVSYDGQAAIELEALAETVECSGTESYRYRVVLHESGPAELDFSQMIMDILADVDVGIPPAVIAARFHVTLATAATDVCLIISGSSGLDRVILSGGAFQNRLLSEMVYNALTKNGLQVFTHRLVPPNDGGIALGQAAIAGRRKVSYVSWRSDENLE